MTDLFIVSGVDLEYTKKNFYNFMVMMLYWSKYIYLK